ncbi:hypothetical protein TNCV_1401821 [Trichonephila clavipes]|nr:hypothetical protein TNCV_1401821 [Trichonephila clavipes]
MSLAEVARNLNISSMVMSRLWKQFQTTGALCCQKTLTRSKATTSMEDRYLTINARRYRDMIAKKLAQDFAAVTGKTTYRQTVYRLLAENAFYAQQPVA